MTIANIFDGLTNSGYLICALFVCLSCLYYTVVKNKFFKLQNKIFLIILLNILISIICDLCNSTILPYVKENPSLIPFQEINQFIYFALHSILSPLFCFYIAIVIGAHYRLSKKYHLLYELPMIITEILVIANPVTHYICYFDENRQFVRNKGESIIYIVSTFYFIAAILLIMLFWKAIDIKKRKTLVYFFTMVALGMLLQLLQPAMHIELFMESLAITGVLITVENEDDRRNPRTGAYNELALSLDISMLMATKHPFSLICLKMANPQNLMQTVGPMNIENLTAMNISYLRTLLPNQNIYYMNPGTFIVMNSNVDREKYMGMAETIYDRFLKEWDFQGRKTVFHGVVFYVEIPKDFGSREQLMGLIGSPVTENIIKKNSVLYGEDLRFIFRRAQVERAILTGVKNRSFEVYYQPIYDASDRSIKSGEALLRLHDTIIGEIYPDEFLSIAERNGMIFELGDFVLEEVCKFLNSGIPVEMGIETLNVNLSSVQCTQANYANRIIQIVSRYDVDPERINFEIMESAANTDFEGLKSFITTLKDHGFHFSVDDYGIGYSNVHSIFSLDVDIIKIDRTILWEAEQTKVGRIIMESSTEMIKRMGKKLLISGVESKAQVELAQEFGVDYLQGFYFSNPVSQNEFIGILKATRLARMEEQRAIAANEAMSNFLANMSHEIRTPINAVLGMDEMILRESEDEKIIEYAKTIKGAGKTLLSLINDILDFSKIEAGNMEIVNADYQLDAVLKDVINIIQVKASQKGLDLIINVDPDTPYYLRGDEMRLRQIMINVLNNAVKYTTTGTVTLSVTFTPIDNSDMDGTSNIPNNLHKNINLIISIADTGVGIREKDMDKLFGKFERLDPSKNRTVEGSGLGLAIVHNLLELMNGNIDVQSVYGEGSTFTITLPQAVVADEIIGNMDNKLEKPDLEVAKYKESFRAPEAKILVVDDTPVNMVVVKNLLKKTEIQIDVAESGKECLEKSGISKYDLIFLDYRMPEMDGIETLKRLKNLKDNPNKTTPVIALTANALSGAREHFIKEGFDNYMTKPINADSLESTLLKYLPADKIIN